MIEADAACLVCKPNVAVLENCKVIIMKHNYFGQNYDTYLKLFMNKKP